MGLMDVLRKLGIFRAGATSGTFKNAKERPTELQMDGVFDAEKDLVTKQDVRRVVDAAKGQSAPKTDS